MADTVAGKAAMSVFDPRRSITIVTFWQGMIEIVLRGVSLVVAFILIIAAAVSLDDLNHDNYDKLDAIGALNNFDWEWEDTTSLARSACGFLVFLALVVLLVEGLITAQRFLNFRIMDNFIILFHIADLAISGVFAFLFFCLAIATAVYGGHFGTWEQEYNDDTDNYNKSLGDAGDLDEDMGTVSFFCFVELFLFAVLAAFMGLCLMRKWRNTQIDYATTPGALGEGTD